MRREKPPPVQIKMLDSQGNLNPMWLKWFQRVGLFFDDYRRAPDLTYTTNANLTTDDFGKSIVFNIGSSTVTCTLMTITSKDVHCWVGPIYRIGTGRLIITADSASSIEYSSLGGSIYCNEPRRAAANVTLEVVSTGQWGITGGTGLWLAD
jgi:hypothetical protein